MNKTVKTVWNTITTILLVCVCMLAILLGGAKMIGLKNYMVLSGSMEPVIQTGSLIYVKEVDVQELQSGDVITFRLVDDVIVTHRIIEVIEEETTMYRTKGDANEVEDGSLVPYENVIGTPVFTIPMLGYLASYLQTSSGMYMLIAVGAVLLLLVLIPELFNDEKKGSNE